MGVIESSLIDLTGQVLVRQGSCEMYAKCFEIYDSQPKNLYKSREGNLENVTGSVEIVRGPQSKRQKKGLDIRRSQTYMHTSNINKHKTTT